MDRTTTDERQLVGALEASRILGLHRSTVNRLAKAGKLSAAVDMPGETGARLFTLKALADYKRTQKPTAAPDYDDVTS